MGRSMRERTQAEYDHVCKAVYEQCRLGGKSKHKARLEARRTTYLLLSPKTPQPLSAALWLERQRRFGLTKDKRSKTA